jgi:hypothetical protein
VEWAGQRLRCNPTDESGAARQWPGRGLNCGLSPNDLMRRPNTMNEPLAFMAVGLNTKKGEMSVERRYDTIYRRVMVHLESLPLGELGEGELPIVGAQPRCRDRPVQNDDSEENPNRTNVEYHRKVSSKRL